MLTSWLVCAEFDAAMQAQVSWYEKMLRGIQCLTKRYGGAGSRVNFCVALPPYVTLREQTQQRLIEAGVVGSDQNVILLYGVQAKKSQVSFRAFPNKIIVQMFLLHDDSSHPPELEFGMQKPFVDLERDAIGHPDQLFVLIADEAHWGIKAGSAHDCFVNSPKLTKLANVLVLLVSATPANLLTFKSRIRPQCLEGHKQEHQPQKVCPINPSFLEGCNPRGQSEGCIPIIGLHGPVLVDPEKLQVRLQSATSAKSS